MKYVGGFFLAKSGLKKQSKYADNRLSKREFRTFVQLVVDEMPGADSFDYFVEFLVNSVEVSHYYIFLKEKLYYNFFCLFSCETSSCFTNYTGNVSQHLSPYSASL